MHQDPLQTCPYDPVHQIFRSRMPYHLTRCRKNFPCTNMKQCPFDARHLVNPIEFNYHVENCPAREQVWHYKLQCNEKKLEQSLLPIETEPAAVAASEDWDDAPEVRSYNPERNIQNRAIVRTTAGLSKAKRRQFRMDERHRFQQIDAMNERKEKAPTKVEEEPVDEYKPLRRPKKLLSETMNSSIISLNSSLASAVGEKSTQQKKIVIENQTKATTSKEPIIIKEVQETTATEATQQIKIVIENQTKATTSKEPIVTKQVQEITATEAPKTNESRKLRRPKTLPTNISSASEQSLNASNSAQIKCMPSNESASSTSSMSAQKANSSVPNGAPFSYAAALSKNVPRKIDEKENYDDEKENMTNNSFNTTGNDTILGKLSKTFDELKMDDEGHKKKTEQLDKEIEKLKTLKQTKNTNLDCKPFNIKCGANFPTLK